LPINSAPSSTGGTRGSSGTLLASLVAIVAYGN
jgi:hypothetical protein